MKKNLSKLNNFLTALALLLVLLILLFIFLTFIWRDSSLLLKKQENYRQSFNFGTFEIKEDLDYLSQEIISLGKEQANMQDLSFTVSPNGQSFAYLIKEDSGQRVALNGQLGPLYDSIRFIIFSPDSQRFAYGAKHQGKEFVVLDNKLGAAYDWIFEPFFFTPDSQYFVYKARVDKGDLVVLNNQADKAYSYVYRPFVSDDAKLIYYSRSHNKLWRTVIGLD